MARPIHRQTSPSEDYTRPPSTSPFQDCTVNIEFKDLSVDQLCEVLRTSSPPFDDDVVHIIRRNKITGRVLAEINDRDLCELGVAAFGDRRGLLQLATQKFVALKPSCEESAPTRDNGSDNSSSSESEEEVCEQFCL